MNELERNEHNMFIETANPWSAYPTEFFLEYCKETERIEKERIESQIIKHDFEPKRIIKSGPCTIVFWNDGTKTVVKRSEDDAEDDYSAFTAALAKKVYGSTSAVKRIVERTEEQKEKKAQKELEEKPVGMDFGKALAQALLKALEKSAMGAQKGE